MKPINTELLRLFEVGNSDKADLGDNDECASGLYIKERWYVKIPKEIKM